MFTAVQYYSQRCTTHDTGCTHSRRRNKTRALSFILAEIRDDEVVLVVGDLGPGLLALAHPGAGSGSGFGRPVVRRAVRGLGSEKLRYLGQPPAGFRRLPVEEVDVGEPLQLLEPERGLLVQLQNTHTQDHA